MSLNASLAPVLAAAERGELLILAGAGISMLPPSCLPDWMGFNRALLTEVKALALTLPGISEDAAKAIERLDLKHLAVEGLSDTVVQSLAGEDYFPLLEVLDSEQANAHHQAIAELGRRGACKAIVTTNFDTLIERAFKAAGASLAVFAEPESFRADPGSSCALYKIHGSVTASTTLVDTVTQKLRGLAFPVRARLKDLFRRHYVLVAGFSGADLAFGSDYLAFSGLKSGEGRIGWVVQPGRRLRPEAEAIVRAAGGSVLEATLSEVFAHLGAAVANEPLAALAAESGSQAEADARARTCIQQWLQGLGSGSLAALLFCIRLANELGWRGETQALENAVRADLERPRETLPLTALIAFQALASAADERGDYEACEKWLQRALNMYAEFERRRQALAAPVKPAGMRQMEQVWIAMCVQTSRCRAALGDLAGARDAIQRGRRAAENDAKALSLLLANEGLVSRREGGSPEHQLNLFRRALMLANRAGFAQGMTECASLEAHCLTTLGEYDAALQALNRANPVARWSGGLLARLGPDLLRGELAARRGQIDEAIARLQHSVTESASDPVMQARVMFVALNVLAYHPKFRSQALSYIERILSGMADGHLPADGRSQHVPPEIEVRKIREDLERAGAGPLWDPFFLAVPESVQGEERELRMALLQAEFEGDVPTVAKILVALANRRYDEARPRRMLDLAEAATASATRSSEPTVRHAALQVLGIACDLSGDLERSMEANRQVLNSSPPAPEELRIAVARNLGFLLGKMGRLAEAEPLFQEAIHYHKSKGNIAEQARAIIALADALASGPDAVRAQAVLDEGRSVIDATADPLAMAKRDSLCASIRSRNLPGGRGATQLLFLADGMAKLTVQQLEELRHRCESAEERCDLAALALQSGQVPMAHDLLTQARTSFHQAGNAQGLALCFQLFADAAQHDGRWDTAADFTRHALSLYDDLEDRQGQIASYAVLAFQFLQVERLDGARWAASQCLRRTPPGSVSRFTALANYVLLEAGHRQGGQRQARQRAKILRRELSSIDDLPAGSSLRRYLDERLAALASPSGLVDKVGSWLAGLAKRPAR